MIITWVYLSNDRTYVGCRRCKRPMLVPQPFVPANGVCWCGGLIGNIPHEES